MASFKNLGIRWKLLSISLLGLILISVLSAVQHIRDIRTEAVRAVEEKSKAVVLAAESAREEMTKKLAMGVVKPFEELSGEALIEAVPIVTAINVAAKKAEEAGYVFRVPKFQPRNPDNTPDSLEASVLKAMMQGQITEQLIEDEDNIHYFRAITLTQGCLTCHGDPKGSPDPLGGIKEGWKVGQVHGAFHIISSLDKTKTTVAKARNSIILTSVLVVLLIGAALLYVVHTITNPLKKVTDVAKAIAVGDLNQHVDIDQQDEVGRLADSFRTMTEALKDKADAAEQIAGGNLAVELKVASDKDILGKSMANMVQSLKEMNAEVGSLTQAALEGRLDTRADASRHEGDYGKVIGGINELLDAVVAPIQEGAKVLESAAGKDLTRRVEGSYKGQLGDLKDNINATIGALDEALTQVGGAVEQVSAASGQVSSGSQSLAQGASEQASSLEEVSSSLEEMASMTRQNADNANQAKSLSGDARKSAEQGNEAMVRMSESIDRIKSSSDETAKIIKTIDEIAFQTNLLALNAAVEAARAGEAGKGFAVVAEEVRNLAQRSAEAAKNTAAMIEESVSNAKDGVQITEEVAKILAEIFEGSGKVNDLVAEISAAVGEQSQGIELVNNSVAEMDKVTQQNAANSEESASAAEQLNGQAEEMRRMVEEFKLTAAGSADAWPGAEVKRKGRHPDFARQAPAAKPKKNRIREMAKSGNGGDGAKAVQAKAADPESIIPMDDEDFGDF